MNWDEILKEQESDPGFAPVPADKYTIRVEKAEALKASTGADMIKLECNIIGGPYDGKKVWTNIVFTIDNPKAMRFTFRKLAALGVAKETLAAQNPSYPQIAEWLVGSEAIAEVTVREWEGEKTNDVKGLKSTTSGAGADAPPIPVPSTESVTPPPPPVVPDPPAVPEPAAPAAVEPEAEAVDPEEEPF